MKPLEVDGLIWQEGRVITFLDAWLQNKPHDRSSCERGEVKVKR